MGDLARDFSYGRSEQAAAELVARYRANVRLGVDGPDKWFVDANGERHTIPPTVTQMVFRVLKMAHGTSRTQHDPWLVLCEASGEPVLSIPPYGLDDYDVRKFAAAAGWDLDLAGTQLDGWDKGPNGWDATFPHWYDKPRSWANGRWVESRWAKLKQRFSGRGRFGSSP